MNGQRTSGQRPPAELRLAPRPQSVREARRFLRRLLQEAGRDEWVDSAELALSEVVTNGVLHAHTELTVRVHVRPDSLEVEVEDGNPMLPMQRRSQATESTTGRGLELVAALTRDCGVRPGPTGKTVWFLLGGDLERDLTADELLAAWESDDAWDVAQPRVPAPAAGVREVVLEAMPTALWMAAREHHSALLRELVLYLAEHGGDVTAPDLALADEARNLIWSQLLAAVDAARAEGVPHRPHPIAGPADRPSPLADVPERIDLRLPVPGELTGAFAALQDALDTGEQLARGGRLLVRPALPELVAVRDWACEQVVAQLAGVPPTPWPGADQAHFTDLAHGVAPQHGTWDSAAVTSSARGVVAADEANRILAVSPPLAEALGWDADALVGRRVVALIPHRLREAHVVGFSRHLTTGEAHVIGVQVVLPVLRRDGSEVSCSFLLERVDPPGGRPVYLAWIDPESGS